MVDGERTYRDGVDVTAGEFHDRLSGDGPLPTTSQPAPAHFLETFGRAAEEGEQVVGVILGSSLSGTLGSAVSAAERFGVAPVHLMDSLAASLLQGLLVVKACELAELGRAPEEIVEELVRIRARSGILFTVDTFERLIASGRVGRGLAAVGSVLGVKPLLHLDESGQVVPVGRAFGRERARAALLEELARRVPPKSAKVRFGVVHVGPSDIVGLVSDGLRARYGPDVEILAAPATPVIATHLGLGAWGVAYLVEEGG
jgi:DegV family protein with EDD domain